MAFSFEKELEIFVWRKFISNLNFNAFVSMLSWWNSVIIHLYDNSFNTSLFSRMLDIILIKVYHLTYFRATHLFSFARNFLLFIKKFPLKINTRVPEWTNWLALKNIVIDFWHVCELVANVVLVTQASDVFPSPCFRSFWELSWIIVWSLQTLCAWSLSGIWKIYRWRIVFLQPSI